MTSINWHYLHEDETTKPGPPPAFIRFVWAVSGSSHVTQLEKSEELDLVARAQAQDDSDAMARLICSHERLLAKMTYKVARQNGMAHMQADMMQTAITAFSEAVLTFNTKEDVRLATFARYRVGGALLKFALDFRHAMPVGRSSDERKAYYRGRAVIDAFVQNQGRRPNSSTSDIGDLAGRLGVSPKAMKRGLSANEMQTLPLHQIEAWDNDTASMPDVDRDAVRVLLDRAIAATLAPLKERDREIVRTFFNDPEEFDGPTVAKMWGLTPERIGQIRRGAIARLRKTLTGMGLDFSDMVSTPAA